MEKELKLYIGDLYPKNPGSSKVSEMEAIIDSAKSDWKGHTQDGLTIIGKVKPGGHRFMLENSEGERFFAVVKDLSVNSMGSTVVQEELGEIVIDLVKLGKIKYDPKLFIPHKANTPMDHIFSKKGGIMPATNYIIPGDPGIGKSTLSIEYGAQVQKNNPDLKVLFISGEMTRIDLAEYLERFEDWNYLTTAFVSEFTEGRYKESFEVLFNQGWDLIVGDSFAEITEAVKEDFNMHTKGKLSSSGSEKWLIDQMVKNNLAENDENLHTSFIWVQQVTKGGKFVGSNKLKHNTTGMIELRYTGSGERKIVVSKNRRGTGYGQADLHFDFPEHGKIPVTFDTARIEREREILSKINADREEILSDERKLNELFNIGEPAGEEFEEAILNLE